MSKAEVFQHTTCTNRVTAAPIQPEGQIGVTQETTIDRSLAQHLLPAVRGPNEVRLVKQFGRGAA